MFSSLRKKLSMAFAAVIILSLLLAGSASAFLVRGYHSELAAERLAELAVPVTYQVSMLERAEASSEVMASYLQDQGNELGVRILLLNASGSVVQDSAGDLQGHPVELVGSKAIPNTRQGGTVSASLAIPGEGEMYCVVTRTASVRELPGFVIARSPSSVVVLAVPQQSIAGAWQAVFPSISLAAIMSLVVSVAVAYVLARSIAKPIRQVTLASEAMAKGHYEQEVEASGEDEVSRLARSFNAMAKQVDSTHRTLREFLANASHELKTPLTSIQGFSQAMVDGAISEPSEYRRAATIINTEAERMRKLVDDLLFLSSVEGGQANWDLRQLNLIELVNTCLERFRWRAEQSKVELIFQHGAAPTLVMADGRRLEQVFGNLLDNAVRYAGEGGRVTIHVEVVSEGKPLRNGGQRLSSRVRVHNTGSYIPAEELPRVFERFYRGQAAPNRAREGTGLGLAIVREIVMAHGGSVDVRSGRETGTEFVIDLPLAEGELD